MRQLQWQNNPLDHQGRAQAGAQSQKEHFAAFIAAQSLHGGIIYHFYGTFENGFEIEARPAFAQIPRISKWPVANYRSGIANGNGCIRPVGHQFANAGKQAFGRQTGARREFPPDVVSRGEELDMSSANINYQNVHKNNQTD